MEWLGWGEIIVILKSDSHPVCERVLRIYCTLAYWKKLPYKDLFGVVHDKIPLTRIQGQPAFPKSKFLPTVNKIIVLPLPQAAKQMIWLHLCF